MPRDVVMTHEASREAPRSAVELGSAVESALSTRIAAGDRVVLVGTGLGNVGDCAIAVATRRWLERTVGRWVELDRRTYSKAVAARGLGADGVVLLAGGGTIGDVWPSQEALRRRAVGDFPGHRVLQLPQTIHFESASAQAEAGAFYRSHPRLTLLLRDAKSLSLARDGWGVDAALVPDVALTLVLPRAAPAEREVLWLLRADQESERATPGGPMRPAPVEGAVDWPPAPPAWRRRLRRTLAGSVGSRSAPRRRAWLARLDAAHALRRLEEGCALVSKGRAVVTDRLHGAILSILMRIPVTIVPDRHGKLRGFHDTWLRRFDAVRWCDSPDEARALFA